MVRRCVGRADVPVVLDIAAGLECRTVGLREVADDAARCAQDQRAHTEDTVDDLIGPLHLREEGVRRGVEFLVVVVVAVVADGMMLGVDALQDIGVELCMLACHIEGRVDSVLLEDVEDGRRVLVVGAIVEGQVDDLALFIGREVRHHRRQPLRAALRQRVPVVDRYGRIGELQV